MTYKFTDLLDLLDLLLRESPVGIVILEGEALTVRHVNPAFRSMAGLGNEVEGQHFEEVFPELDTSVLELMRRVIQTGRPTGRKIIETRAVTTADGAPTFWSAESFPLRSENSKTTALALIAQNVTDQVLMRQEAEDAYRALDRSQAHLRLAVEAAPVTLSTRDRDLRLSWLYNPRWQLGIEPLVGTALDDVYTEEDAAALHEFYRPVLEYGQTARRLFHLHHKDGKHENWAEVHARPVFDGEGAIVGVSSAGYDVTEHVETQHALAEREALLRLALEASDMGHWEYDLASGQVRHSAHLAQIHGLPADREVTPVGLFLGLVHPDDLADFRQRFARILAEDTVFHLSLRMLRLDGHVRWLELRGHVLRRRDGSVDRLIGITLDVTKEHELRERLQRSNRDLERFAATVAHDLKSPLQTILGFGGLLARSVTHRLSESERQHFGYIIDATRQLTDLVDGVLESARASRSTAVEAVPLEEIFSQCLLRLGTEIERTGAMVTHDPLPSVAGNRVLLTQALQNLLANALKYRAKRPLYIHIGTRHSGGELIISIRDNGIGIAPERQARLFEAFTRAHTGESYDGLGLGLALVKAAADHHGGRVWVESAPDAGSTFHFCVPSEA